MSQNIKVHLRYRQKSNGMTAIILDVSYGSTASYDSATERTKYTANRERKKTGLEIYTSPRTPDERKHNKDILTQAEALRYEKEQTLKARTIISKEDLATDKDFFEFYEDYIEIYTKKDLRHIKRALRLFKEYLSEKRQFRCFRNKLDCKAISETMISGFAEFLQKKFKGEGPHTVFQRFKKVIRRAVKEGYLNHNPCEGITISYSDLTIRKETLNFDEINKLRETNFPGLNQEIRRAFIFSLITGIRGCDLRKLTFQNVSFSDKKLKFEQVKTEGRSSASTVIIPLTDYHMELIGKPKNGDLKLLIFELPSDTYCNRQLKDWMTAAGIEKHITWYCARHSFGSNLSEKNINAPTIMNLLGHASLKYTNRYIDVRDKTKTEAIEQLVNDILPFKAAHSKEPEENNIREFQKCYVKIFPFILDNEIKYMIKDLITDRVLTDCNGWGFNTEEDARKMIEGRKTWVERPMGLDG